MAKYRNRTDVVRAVVKSLRAFGYPDVTMEMVRGILDAWMAGRREHELPHGIIGMMAESQFEEVEDALPGFFEHLEAS